MKLLFYSPRFYPLLGGLERVVEAWGSELVRKGVEVTLVTTTANHEADHFVFPVYRNPSFLKTISLMRSADLVVQFNVSLKGLPAWWISRKPLLITHHTLLYEKGTRAPWNQRLKRRVSDRLAVQNICCSRYIAAQFQRAVVVNSPYNAGVFYSTGQNRKPGSIVFAGRLVTDKGVDLLLQALAAIDPSAYESLSIAGDGPERTALEALAKTQGLAGKVQFLGAMDAGRLVALLNQSEVMVVPSRVEPFGITVLEGLACGCRMVVSDTGGLPEAAGGFAELFASGDVKSLAAAITKALTQPLAVDEGAVSAHLSKITVEYTAEKFLEATETPCPPKGET